MFSITFRYIFKKIFLGTALLTTVIVMAVWLTQSLRFLDMIVNRSVSLEGYFYLVGFLLPELIVLLLPICLFISVIYHYNKFSVESELSIWRSCGMSNLNIASPVLVLTGIMTVFVFMMNVFVLPQTFSKFKDTEHLLRQQFTGAMLQEGKFNNFRSVTAYVKERFRSGRLRGVHIYHKQKQPYTIIADEGRIELVDEKVQLLLKNGVRQEVDPKTGKINALSFQSLHYDLSSLLKPQEERTVRPYEKSLEELSNPPGNLDEGLKNRYRAALHLRLLQPFFGLMYIMIALVILLVGYHRRKGRASVITGAFLGAFVFHMMMMTLLNMNGKVQGSIHMAYMFYSFLFTGLLWTFFRKQYGWRKA